MILKLHDAPDACSFVPRERLQINLYQPAT